MGCTGSKLDNEDTVRRCKERRRLIKEAFYARHHLAAAHSDYCRSLRITGSALVTFASGEPLPVSVHTPAVLLRDPSSTTAGKPPTFIPPPPRHHTPSPSLPPPPPAPPMSTSSSSHHQPPPQPRREKPMKVPHILSDSSISSSPTQNDNTRFTNNARTNSTIVSTPSQASSAWNWNNLQPPPTPPDSEYFEKLQKNKKNHDKNSDEDYYTDYNNEDDDKDSNFSIRNSNYRQEQKKQPNLRNWESKEEEETEREEVECSEWGDHGHYTSTSSSTDEERNLKMKSRNDGENPNLKNEANANMENVNSYKLSSNSVEDYGSLRKGKNKGVDSDKKIMVRHKDLAEIVIALKKYFDKAADAGELVSEMLEIDRSFKQLRKNAYHSSGMLSTLNSSWTSKPPLAVKYRFASTSINQSGRSKSLYSTLEQLLAWEMKLYQEVKAREGVKIKLEKELSTLQSHDYQGGHEAKADKKKMSVNKLQSLVSLKSQDVSATSSAIVGLRDSDLVPLLVELCHGFMYMWKSMNQHHGFQNNIVQQVQGLVNHTTKDKPTSDLHRQATSDLQSALSTWHSTFRHVIKFQRDFISSLHGWFKLTLERTNGSTAFTFLDEWKLVLDRVPDSVPSEAIKSFINVINSIFLKHNEDLKIRKRAESFSKELEKKGSSLRSVERKYYKSYSMVGVGIPDNGPISDELGPLAEKKAELSTSKKKVEDEMVKYWKAVEVTRAMTLNNVQTGLPGVFQAVVSFSGMMVEVLETVCNRSYAIL